MPTLPTPALPLITARSALFLDFDGTLVELAAKPDQVCMLPAVLAALAALQHLLGGALALVSGRKLTDLDAYTRPLCLAAAAEHGSVRRKATGHIEAVAPVDLQDALQTAQALVRLHPALLLEPKTHALSLHYRQAPGLEQACITAMQAAAQRSNGLELIRGKFVVELKPQGASKGLAINRFMQEPPFKGRSSLFAGDDVTDESGFTAVQSAGGQAIKVGPGSTAAHHRCRGPAEVGAWLQAAAAEMTSRQHKAPA